MKLADILRRDETRITREDGDPRIADKLRM